MIRKLVKSSIEYWLSVALLTLIGVVSAYVIGGRDLYYTTIIIAFGLLLLKARSIVRIIKGILDMFF